MKLLERFLFLIITLSLLVSCVNQFPTSPLPKINEEFTTKNTEKQSFEINLLTLNTWGLPSPIGTKLKERMTRIGKSVNNFDIVSLQETFTGDSNLIGLNSNFQYQHWENNSSTFKISSGLYNLSKYKIKEVKFAEYPKGVGFDKYARKGVLLTRLEVPDLGEVDIYNTHYQSGGNQEEAELRLKDNIAMSEFIKKNNKGNLTILFGDYNFIPDSKEYRDLYTKTLFIDTFRVKHPLTPGYTSDPVLNPYCDKKEPRQRLDYIFVLPNYKYLVRVLNSEVVFTSPVDGYFLSDHFGVNTRIEVRKILSK